MELIKLELINLMWNWNWQNGIDPMSATKAEVFFVAECSLSMYVADNIQTANIIAMFTNLPYDMVINNCFATTIQWHRHGRMWWTAICWSLLGWNHEDKDSNGTNAVPRNCPSNFVVLNLPHINADCDKAFSDVRKGHTECHQSLNADMLSVIIENKLNNNRSCNEFNVSEEKLWLYQNVPPTSTTCITCKMPCLDQHTAQQVQSRSIRN